MWFLCETSLAWLVLQHWSSHLLFIHVLTVVICSDHSVGWPLELCATYQSWFVTENLSTHNSRINTPFLHKFTQSLLTQFYWTQVHSLEEWSKISGSKWHTPFILTTNVNHSFPISAHSCITIFIIALLYIFFWNLKKVSMGNQ